MLTNEGIEKLRPKYRVGTIWLEEWEELLASATDRNRLKAENATLKAELRQAREDKAHLDRLVAMLRAQEP
jgi:hypothetical protein